MNESTEEQEAPEIESADQVEVKKWLAIRKEAGRNVRHRPYRRRKASLFTECDRQGRYARRLLFMRGPKIFALHVYTFTYEKAAITRL
jgi:hypothetical protein